MLCLRAAISGPHESTALNEENQIDILVSKEPELPPQASMKYVIYNDLLAFLRMKVLKQHHRTFMVFAHASASFQCEYIKERKML